LLSLGQQKPQSVPGIYLNQKRIMVRRFLHNTCILVLCLAAVSPVFTQSQTKVGAVKNSGIYVSPTNYFFVSTFGEPMTEEQIKKTAGYRYIPSVTKNERWQNWDHYNKNAPPEASRRRYVQLRKQMAYQLWRAGVPLMAGSDSPEFFVVQGFSLHDELEMFVRSGLTPFASLQTATINPAKYLGVDKQKGAIGPGKQALMLLLDKNPLEDIKNTNTINTVFMGKKWYDKAAIEKMLAEAAQILGK